MSPRVDPVPCLSDNYAYLVRTPGRVAVVDPGESAPVLAVLERLGLPLDEVWCTHHHGDHVAGVPELVERFPALIVRGSDHDLDHSRIARQTVAHADGSTFGFGSSEVRVIGIPGHTLGAIAFLVDGLLFSGDTLFLGGCGRVFEGTMPMMAASMRRLRELPPATRVYCGHEYTTSNLRFARSIEPANVTILAALDEAIARTEAGLPTVPGTIAHELETNPFFRFDLPVLAEGRPADESFARLREAKNSFRG